MPDGVSDCFQCNARKVTLSFALLSSCNTDNPSQDASSQVSPGLFVVASGAIKSAYKRPLQPVPVVRPQLSPSRSVDPQGEREPVDPRSRA